MATTSSVSDNEQPAFGRKRGCPSALQLGPRKKPSDLLVHHGHHFGQVVHAFCNVQTLIANGLQAMSDDTSKESLPAAERKECTVFCELLRIMPGLECRLMESSEKDITMITDMIQKGANDARADDTKGMKGPIINWITPKGQSLNPHISHNVNTRSKLANGELQVVGDQWPIFLYANYMYDEEDPWNGLLHGGLLVSTFKHVFTSPSSVDQEPKATHSGNARIHGMRSMTKASLAYVATQAQFALTSAQVFSHTDLVTDSKRFYNSILELLDDPQEKEEVDQLMIWWNHQVFPLYTEIEHLPSKDSALARIRQKHAEHERAVVAVASHD
ncbi:hypothetical protein V8E55_005059 [Tylopilus felleus]